MPSKKKKAEEYESFNNYFVEKYPKRPGFLGTVNREEFIKSFLAREKDENQFLRNQGKRPASPRSSTFFNALEAIPAGSSEDKESENRLEQSEPLLMEDVRKYVQKYHDPRKEFPNCDEKLLGRAFRIALIRNELENAKKFIILFSDINIQIEYGRTALHFAAISACKKSPFDRSLFDYIKLKKPDLRLDIQDDSHHFPLDYWNFEVHPDEELQKIHEERAGELGNVPKVLCSI